MLEVCTLQRSKRITHGRAKRAFANAVSFAPTCWLGLDVVCFMACCLNRLVMNVLVTFVISFCYCPLVGSSHVWPEAAQQEAHLSQKPGAAPQDN
jgi:hypothetical protein